MQKSISLFTAIIFMLIGAANIWAADEIFIIDSEKPEKTSSKKIITSNILDLGDKQNKSSAAGCTGKFQGPINGYYLNWYTGNEYYAVYQDPSEQGCTDTYPFGVDFVRMQLLNVTTSSINLNGIRVMIWDVDYSEPGCPKPGEVLLTGSLLDVSIPATGMVFDLTIYFSSPFCVNGPYFAGILFSEYIGWGTIGIWADNPSSARACALYNDWGVGWKDLVVDQGMDHLMLWSEGESSTSNDCDLDVCDPNDQWPTYAHDYGRTSRSGIKLGDITGLTRQWASQISGHDYPRFASPVIANDIVYITSVNAGIHAYDLLTGELIWSAYTHPSYSNLFLGEARSAPTVDLETGYIYFGTGSAAGFICADGSTGNIIWAKGLMSDDPLPCSSHGATRWAHSVIVGDYVFFGTQDGCIYMVDKYTGYVLNYYSVGANVWNSPCFGHSDLFGDLLFFGTASGSSGPGSIWAISADGSLAMQWEYRNINQSTLSDGFTSSPVFYKGNLLAHANVGFPEANNGHDGYRINLNVDFGVEQWSDYEMGRSLYSTPAVYNGIAYFGSDYPSPQSDLGLKAVDIETNTIVWQEEDIDTNADYLPMPPSLTCDPYIFSGTRNGRWRIHDAETGEFLLQYHLDYPLATAIAHGSDGKNYVVTCDWSTPASGDFYAYLYAFAVEQTYRPRMHIPQIILSLDSILATETEPVFRFINGAAIANLGYEMLEYTATLVAGTPPKANKNAESQIPPSWVSWYNPPSGNETTAEILGPGDTTIFAFEIDPTALQEGRNDFYIDIGSNDPDFNPWADPQPDVQTRMIVSVNLVSPFKCGDANGDDEVNVGDAVFVINHVFKGGPPPYPFEACDSNCDDQCNVGDAVYMISTVFKGGPPPCFDCP
ncbi:MAG: PQQ-binding-like beta-propeller repeat protein [Candidatus Zixiibacteriota bacterium]